MPALFRLVLHASSRAFSFAGTESGFAWASRQASQALPKVSVLALRPTQNIVSRFARCSGTRISAL